MDLRFSEEQELLRSSARKLLEKECGREALLQMWQDDKGFSPQLWTQISELGWLGLRIPETYNGVGLDFVDLGILFEEMGRAVMPGPFLSTAMTAEVIMDGGSSDQKKACLPAIAEGRTRAALAVWEPDYRYDAAGIFLSAVPDGNDFLLDGTKLFVLDAHVSQWMVVAARTRKTSDPEEGITLFLVNSDASGISIQLHNTMDGGRKQCEVFFDNVQIPASQVLGPVDGGWDILTQTLKKGAVALSLESVGGGQRVLDMAVDYAKIRVQFGRPIGSFQAIKHKCAQIMLEVEGARSIAYYAAWTMDQEGKESAIAASAAKAYCSEMYQKAAKEAVQIFGAIGLTWEHDMHFFLKRAKMNEFAFGEPSFHKEHLARLSGY